MSERHLYGDGFSFEGSIDDDGRIYDAKHHWFLGYIKDGKIYNNCNICQGWIDDDGQVRNNCNQVMGKEFGTSYVGYGGSSGIVRSDVLGVGHGSDYGALSLLNGGTDRVGNHLVSSMESVAEDDDVGDDLTEDNFDDYINDSYEAQSSCGNSGGGSCRRRGSSGGDFDEETGGCCGCLVLVIAALVVWALFS